MGLSTPEEAKEEERSVEKQMKLLSVVDSLRRVRPVARAFASSGVDSPIRLQLH
jgi:hypothetical protein